MKQRVIGQQRSSPKPTECNAKSFEFARVESPFEALNYYLKSDQKPSVATTG